MYDLAKGITYAQKYKECARVLLLCACVHLHHTGIVFIVEQFGKAYKRKSVLQELR